MVAGILAYFVPLFAVVVRRRAFIQEESFVSFASMAIVLIHKIHVKPCLVVATLVGLSDAESFVVNGECTMLPFSPTLTRVF